MFACDGLDQAAMAREFLVKEGFKEANIIAEIVNILDYNANTYSGGGLDFPENKIIVTARKKAHRHMGFVGWRRNRESAYLVGDSHVH